MPAGLKRFQKTGDLHFITFSCHGRRPYLGTPQARNLFVETLYKTTRLYPFEIDGFVVMPEHVHLLITELNQGALASAIRSVKQSMAQQNEQRPFWYHRYYDFNVYAEARRIEKLTYMHWNPVRRGLCTTPESWLWSSAASHRARIPKASASPLTMGHPGS